MFEYENSALTKKLTTMKLLGLYPGVITCLIGRSRLFSPHNYLVGIPYFSRSTDRQYSSPINKLFPLLAHDDKTFSNPREMFDDKVRQGGTITPHDIWYPDAVTVGRSFVRYVIRSVSRSVFRSLTRPTAVNPLFVRWGL